MKIVADKNIPFLQGVLEPYAEVLYLPGKEIDSTAVRDADALLVRTRTVCNKSLLEGTKVSFIASATIGTDHIDKGYLSSRGIAFSSAPGCNAGGVMQYVHTALFSVATTKNIPLKGRTLGVIGVGNTGGKVAELGEFLGFRVLRNDPPKEACAADKSIYSPLDYLLEQSDIVTLHVPLDHATDGLADDAFFRKMKNGAIFVNASRGEVVVEEALMEAREKLAAIILDVWRGEPSSISDALIEMADIATPHIAGYSYEGKINGTSMVVQALAHHFGIDELKDFVPEHTPAPKLDISREMTQDEIAAQFLKIFPIYELDKSLRCTPSDFEKIRSEYVYRREFVWK